MERNSESGLKNNLKVKTCKKLILTLDLNKLGKTGLLAILMSLNKKKSRVLSMNISLDRLHHHNSSKKDHSPSHNSLQTLTNGMNGWSATSIVKVHKMLNKQQASISLHIL